MMRGTKNDLVYLKEVRFFLVVSGCVIAFVLFGIPWLANRNHAGRDIKFRQSTLRSIPGWFDQYAKEHGGVYPQPDAFLDVVTYFKMIYPIPLLGDEDQAEVWMCPIPWSDRRIPEDITRAELAKIPMLHERVDLNPDGTSVLFWDGHVELLSNEDFARLIDIDQSVCLGCQLPIPESMKNQRP